MGQEVGRPTDYRPEFCDIIIHIGKFGKSVVQMANHFGVTRKTLYEWVKVHPDFAEAFEKAKQHSQDWWETIGQQHAIETPGGAKINAGLYIRSMAARFHEDWREKTDVNHGGQAGNPIEHDVKGGVTIYLPQNGRES